MSLTCEISGQSLVGTDDEVVATPSGHVCLKRLLLTKLAENGGMDPFEPIRERPLSEDQLITLTAMSSKQAPPPRPSVTSLPNLLQMLQQEYDAIMLELFDTRKELQDTRRELSQALYQNDAAVRVVARLSAERDAARQQLEQWKASTGGAAPDNSPAPVTNGKHELDESAPNEAEPQSKRRRVESGDLPLSNDIPDDDLDSMVSAWGDLSKGRKASVKESAAAAPTPEDWSKYQASLDTKAWHKSTCKSITAMARSGQHIVTAGKDKQLIVYNSTTQVVQHSVASKMIPTHVHILGSDADGIVVAASTNAGQLAVFEASSPDETTMSKVGDLKLDSRKLGSVVSITLHPSRQHVFLTTTLGRVLVCAIRKEQNAIEHISTFHNDGADSSAAKYSSGTIHPDGLIYVAGTQQGIVHLWDIKSKVMANSLTPPVRLSRVCCLLRDSFCISDHEVAWMILTFLCLYCNV